MSTLQGTETLTFTLTAEAAPGETVTWVVTKVSDGTTKTVTSAPTTETTATPPVITAVGTYTDALGDYTALGSIGPDADYLGFQETTPFAFTLVELVLQPRSGVTTGVQTA